MKARPPATSVGRKKRVWKQVDLTTLAPAAQLVQRAHRSMAPASLKGKAIYSPPPPVRHWERGECSGVKALTKKTVSPEWQVSKKKY